MVKMTYEIKYRVILARLARVAYPISIYVPILYIYIYDITYKNIKNIKKKNYQKLRLLNLSHRK